jgi:hypothetical protein
VFSLVGLFILFAAVIGSSAMTAVLAYILLRNRQVGGRDSGEFGARSLANQLDGIAEELHSIQGQVSSLTERMDFTEKLLMSGEEPEGPGRNG